MRKFGVPLILTASALLALGACSSGDDSASEPAETAAAPAAAPAATPPAATPAAPAATPAAGAAPAAGGATVTLAGLTGDAAAGQRVFGQCRTCHTVEAGVNRVGPSLHALIGRTAGSVPGYTYSTANKNSGVVWTEENLFAYLENPRAYIPGTKMSFVGLRQPQQRADVIAYLKTQS